MNFIRIFIGLDFKDFHDGAAKRKSVCDKVGDQMVQPISRLPGVLRNNHPPSERFSTIRPIVSVVRFVNIQKQVVHHTAASEVQNTVRVG